MLLLLLPGALGADPVILSFQEAGLPGGNVPIGNFYNGGGGAAVNYGIAFSNNALTHSEDGVRRYMYVEDPNQNIVIDVAVGFTGSISFLYTNEESAFAFVNVYDGPSGTGNLLGFAGISAVPDWTYVPLSFGGTAKSLVLNGYPFYDDLTFSQVGCPSAEIWDPTTNAIVGPLDNMGTYCLTSYNLRAVTCDETAPLVDMRLSNTATNAQIRRQKETLAPYFLWGDDTLGDIFPNQKKLPNGPYRLRVTIDGVDTDYTFTQACS